MGFLSLLSFVERPSSPCILLVCYVAFLPCVNICVYLSKKKKKWSSHIPCAMDWNSLCTWSCYHQLLFTPLSDLLRKCDNQKTIFDLELKKLNQHLCMLQDQFLLHFEIECLCLVLILNNEEFWILLPNASPMHELTHRTHRISYVRFSMR